MRTLIRIVDFKAAALALLVITIIPRHGDASENELDARSTIETIERLDREGRYQEAAPLAAAVVQTLRSRLGERHEEVARARNRLGSMLGSLGRANEAEQEYHKALEILEEKLGPNNADVGTVLANWGDLLRDQGKYTEAEEKLKRALRIARSDEGKHMRPGLVQNALGRLYRILERYDEAEALYKEALQLRQDVLGLEDALVGETINNLAVVYYRRGQYDNAEQLYLKSLDIKRKTLGREHVEVARTLNNLAVVYRIQKRYPEAEALFLEALEIRKKKLGENHAEVGQTVNNIALVLRMQKKFTEAEARYREALYIREIALGPNHPDVADTLQNLGAMMHAMGNYSAAEPLYDRALKIYETAYGAEHDQIASTLMHKSRLYTDRENWNEALPILTKVVQIHRKILHRNGQDGRESQATREQRRQDLSFQARVAWRVRLGFWRDMNLINSSFISAQLSLRTTSEIALAQMVARSSAKDDALQVLARRRQDVFHEWKKKDDELLELLSNPKKIDPEAVRSAQIKADQLTTEIDNLDGRLSRDFSEYASLVNPEPLRVDEVQAQLKDDESLILVFDLSGIDRFDDETFIWVVTKRNVHWLRSDLGTAALTKEVQALRCGLDEEEWATPSRARRCADLLGLSELPDSSHPLPFDLGKAYALYQALFGEVEELIKGKRLIIVPSGALTSLPFHVLVTRKTAIALPVKFEGYRDIAWLGRTNAIVTLPAVSSLEALRQNTANRQKAADDYAGYGDPVLEGDGTSCRQSVVREACSTNEVAEQAGANATHQIASVSNSRATIRGRGGRRSAGATIDRFFGKKTSINAVLEQVRLLCPLPDTAYEIKCVAERFKEKHRLIRLDADAKEADIKALNASGKLANYRVLHFATHGLLSGDVERMAQRQGEPALVLTPPDKPADADDDGLLMATEVATLKLNADWVVLSACNTAAGDKIGAQALSGLARAFFYAGARALLVSHWPVYSDAAVRLTTSAFAELERNPKAGRAEALQRAMILLMDDPSEDDNAHPAVWAPFVVVGEGAP